MARFTKVTSRTPLAGIDFDGPFFERDPGKTVRGNIRDMMDALASEGEGAVRRDIASHAGEMPRYSGWTHDHVIGRTESYSGKRWGLTMVVSANTEGMDRGDAIRTKAAAATIEKRWRPFRRLTNQMRRSRSVLAANLTKGLE